MPWMKYFCATKKMINTGIMAVNRARLEDWLSRIDNLNAKKEYYLTDIIARAEEERRHAHDE